MACHVVCGWSCRSTWYWPLSLFSLCPMARHGVFRKQDLTRAFLVRSRPGGVPCRVAAFWGDLLSLSCMTRHVVVLAEGSEREVMAGGVPCRVAGGLQR